jgi:hypothetical protein
VLTLSALAATALAACGSSSAPDASSTVLNGTAMQQTCTAIGDVLSDGPDPDADPVGYAEAQVLPLRQLTITDPQLHRAVLHLAAAYQAFSTATGDAGTAAALQVSTSEAAVNTICPGVAN